MKASVGKPERSVWAFAVGVALCCTLTGNAFAESTDVKTARDVNAIPVGSLTTLATVPYIPPPPDKLYLTYFSSTDASIYQQYLDRWNYHDTQIRYAATEWNYEHLSLGTRDTYGHAPYEGDVRHDFAQTVLRIRLDAALRECTRDTAGAKGVAQATQTLNQFKNMPVRISSKPGGGEFHVGYDLQSDASKIEYTQAGFSAGLYHPHLMGALTGSHPLVGEMTFRFAATVDNKLPTATLAYQPGTTAVETALSKALNARVTTRVVSSLSVTPGALPTGYRVEVSYQF